VFNRGLAALTDVFSSVVGFFLRRAILSTGIVLAMLAVTVTLFVRVPGSLLPEEDQGYNFLVMLLPPAASLDRTKAVVSTVAENVQKNPAVKDIVAFAGFDILSSAQKTSAGVAFVSLKDWSERTDPPWMRARPRRHSAP
jgi:multidrug efflux pump